MTIASKKIRLVMALRTAGITDTRVLAAIERIPREAFVPDVFRDRSYDDTALPIGSGQTISQPLVVARMTQALDVEKRMKVLEIGTGSGYQTAVLAKLCRRVYTIERIPELLAEAEKRLTALNLRNVTAKAGDGARGWPHQAPFERIIVAAAAERVPQSLVQQLSPDGILVLPVGPEKGGVQRLVRVRRTGDGTTEEDLGTVRFVPLVSDAAAGRRDGARTAGSASGSGA